MVRYLIVTLLVMGAFSANWAAAQNVEFGFDGRVRTTGVPFNGNGLFKFAIVSKDGAVCYWSNDGVTLTGNEPTTSVQIAVSNGFFSITIGDTDVAGMAPLDAAIFNTDEKVRLRVWFNDGTNGFQQLNPDRPITNPSLIGLQSGTGLTIYVNPVTGNDRNGGSKLNKPKKTIQAAWNAVPKLLSDDVTIQLANGTYREGAVLTGKLLAGGTITISGNSTTPTLVRITGALASNETTSTILFGFTIYDQRALVLKGLSFDHFRDDINIAKNSYVEVQNCSLKQYLLNGILMENSYLVCKDSDFGTAAPSPYSFAVHAPFGGFVELTSCNFHDLAFYGLILGRGAQGRLGGCTFKNIGNYGMWLDTNAIATFTDPSSHFENMTTAIEADENCDVSYYVSRVTYTGVTNHLTLTDDSYGHP